MKTCKKCDLKIIDNTSNCPLCKAELSDFDGIIAEDIYPKLEINANEYHFMTKFFVYLSLFCVLAAGIINYFTYDGILWSLISVAAIIYFWAVIIHSIKSSINIASNIFEHALLASIMVIVIDSVLGYSGWAVNYVIPEVMILANIAILILIFVNRMNWHHYVLYQIAIILLGFVPMVLVFFGIINKPFLSIVAAGLSFAELFFTILLSDNSVQSELKRRFHF